MTDNSKARNTIRDLAKRVLEISKDPKQEQRRQIWKKVNRLKKTVPPVVCQPVSAWRELVPEELLASKDPVYRHIEVILRRQIWRDWIDDDHVVEPIVFFGAKYKDFVPDRTWGIETKRKPSSMAGGAWQYDPPLINPDDIEKLRKPDFMLDEKATAETIDKANDLIGDILNIDVIYGILSFGSAGVGGNATYLRGLDQIMIDMYDRPEWLHHLMKFIMDAYLEEHEKLEKQNFLITNTNNTFSYTDELPTKDFDGKHFRMKDLWCSAEGQEFAEVSPSLHDEFLLQYQMPIIEKYGLSGYGCCERLTEKFGILKKIPNLRRVAITPWTNLRTAVEQLGKNYVLSWRPNPSEVTINFSEENVRRTIKEGMEIAGDHIIEVYLKDIETVSGDPEILRKWTAITKEIVADYG